MPAASPTPDARPLRVAMLAPIAWRVPPRGYGPWEQVVATLTEALLARGVEVTLFASADSESSAPLESVAPRPYGDDDTLDAKTWECLHIAHCFEQARAGRFDLIHNHFDFLPLSYAGLVDTPVVTTIHGFSSERILPAYRRANEQTHYLAISDANRHPDLTYAATIHHGLDLAQFPVQETAGDDLLFFGRLHPDKGPHEAIALAKATGRRLTLAGIVQDNDYFEREVEPHLNDTDCVFLGAAGPEQRAELLSHAAALVHLIGFDEPFGLSVAEAMACGTPVIAYDRGSMPELIDHGETGFLCHSFDDAVQAIADLPTLDRTHIATTARARFGLAAWAERHERVYREILAKHRS